MYRQYNHVGDHNLIPKEAFLFRPKRTDNPDKPDDFRRYEGEKFRRLIFEGWAESTYTPKQQKKLQQFAAYLEQHKIVPDQRWTKSWRLRWILSTNYDFEKSVKDMKTYEGHQERVKEMSFTHKIAEHLRAGFFYVVGRDSHYRPIIVTDVRKIIEADPTEDQIMETNIFFLEYIMKHYFIPGQVESWVSIIDSNYQSFLSLVGTLKSSFTFLANTYRMRLYCGFNCQITLSIRMIWAVVQKLLDQETVNKINLYDSLIPEKLFQFTNRSQVEVKFGGTLPNLQEGEFWPPRGEVSPDYKVEKQQVDMMTPQEYTQNYQKKVLFDTKIHEELLIKNEPSEIGENRQKKTMKELQKHFQRQFEQLEQEKLTFPFAMQELAQFKNPLNLDELLKREKGEVSPTHM